MLIFIPILIFVALVIVGAGVKIVPQGYQWTHLQYPSARDFRWAG